MAVSSLRLVLSFILLTSTFSTWAQLSVPEIFSNDMVLQRSKKIPIWGKAAPGSTVQVQFASQEKTAIASADSSWIIYLEPLKANTIGQDLVITSGVTKRFSNVLVGDVWLCSGQSNMEYPLDRSLTRYAGPKRSDDVATAELKRENKSTQVRYIFVEKNLNVFPKLPSKGWFMANDTMLRRVSAIGYFFGKEIQQEVGVPIGIISTSWGGTRIEEWTPDYAYANDSFFAASFAQEKKIDGIKPGQKFRSLFQPLVPFAVKGVLWYQGESNAAIEDYATYPQKFKLFTDTWRALLQDPKLPFYTVQIAPYLYSSRKDAKPHTAALLPAFWEAQTKCMSFPYVDMIVISDLVDDLKDIHPSYKWEVAHRLALQVLKKEYGQKALLAHSPFFVSAHAKGDNVLLAFNNAKGLHSKDDLPINGFELAGANGEWVTADARVVGQNILLKAKGLSSPKNIRFAWDEKAQTNLVNEAGLPAASFQTSIK